MFYLVLWEDKRVSIVEEENVLEITGQMSRIKWGKKEYRSKIIAIHCKYTIKNSMTVVFIHI